MNIIEQIIVLLPLTLNNVVLKLHDDFNRSVEILKKLSTKDLL